MQKELSGGQMVEQTTHLFDLVRYLCGEASSVHCCGAKGFIPISDTYNTDDATGALIKLKNGAFASILSSWSSGIENRIYLNLSGPHISVQFANWELDTKILLRDSPNPMVIPGERDIFSIEDRAFINAIKENNPAEILSDYSDGVKSLEISMAANKSLEYGKSVRLGGKNATLS
jgi:predicted dehydrogenase